jgi:hypothetical protein
MRIRFCIFPECLLPNRDVNRILLERAIPRTFNLKYKVNEAYVSESARLRAR